MARLIALVATALLTAQDTGLLRIRVAMADASGLVTPLPRLVVLVSDDPPSAEPRRVRTSADGTIELKLTAGRYLVELDEPVSFRGRAYTWTQIVQVSAGRDTVLELDGNNADTAASARINADSATLLGAWRDSVVEIWTPTRHASGFVIDAKGLIATSHRAVEGHSTVEVEITSAKDRIKVPGRVLLSERTSGAAFVWVNPRAIAATRPVDPGCSVKERDQPGYKDPVTTIGSSILSPKELADGRVTKVTPQAIFSDMRIGSDSQGGPVFAESGAFLGISSLDDSDSDRRWSDAWIVPVERVCETMTAAVTKMSGPAPDDTRLPIEPASAIAGKPAAMTTKPQPATKILPPVIKASDFDITVFTSTQAMEVAAGPAGMRTDFGAWSQYLRDVPPVLLVRISPQFEESLWKTLARGAAYTQGVALPPLKSFTANFLRMRAYCGDTEVVPIHPFIIEHEVPDRPPIREGLYVFERSAFGQCQTIRVSLFSEKSPESADIKEIDPKLFAQLK
jgi:hypothetical protein